MARAHNATGDTSPRASIYETVTNHILAQLEAGCVPWVQPWATSTAAPGLPANAATGRRYSGINILTLWDAVASRGFSSQRFVSYRQALALGGNVRKGERGTPIVFAGHFVPGTGPGSAPKPAGAEGRGIPFLKWFTVFNVDQCDGLDIETVEGELPTSPLLILPRAAALIEACGADLRIGGPSAYYSPGLDYIQVPRPEDYFEPINWHRTAFHELGHWTGHETRLARDQSGGFGTPSYGREELVAEMAGAFTCAALGIVPTVRHADYIGSWLTILRDDNRAIVKAASAASKAADFMLAFASNDRSADGEDSPSESNAAALQELA